MNLELSHRINILSASENPELQQENWRRFVNESRESGEFATFSQRDFFTILHKYCSVMTSQNGCDAGSAFLISIHNAMPERFQNGIIKFWYLYKLYEFHSMTTSNSDNGLILQAITERLSLTDIPQEYSEYANDINVGGVVLGIGAVALLLKN